MSSVADPSLGEPQLTALESLSRYRLPRSPALLLAAGVLAALAGCESKVPEPASTKPVAEASKPATPATPAAAAGASAATTEKSAEQKAAVEKTAEPVRLREPVFPTIHARPVAEVKPSPGDPVQGKFGMEEALKGLPGKGPKLFADLATAAGKLECELWPDKAPITVANFVGLARGNRPWKKGNNWVKQPLYDGTVIHRVVKGFMLQGGDPEGNGSGGPGYVIPDEIWEDAHHDRRGLLCMANRGPNTNGSQFFIMDGPAPHLDEGGYTIFGKCGPDDVIQKLTSTPVMGDRAVDPPKISKVVVRKGG